MSTTVCYDILVKEAKLTKIKSNAEPGQEDPEYDAKVASITKKFNSQAETIYNTNSAKIKAEYKAKKLAIGASKFVKETEYMMARYNSTDVSKYGEDGIKTTMQRELQKLSQGLDQFQEESEKRIEEQKQQQDEQNQQEAEKESVEEETKSTNKFKEFLNKSKEKFEKTSDSVNNKVDNIKNKINSYKTSPDLVNEASSIGKATDQALDSLIATEEANLTNYATLIDNQARENGERKGIKMVSAYNKAIEKAAKAQHELIQKNLAKAKIKAKQVAQSAKLKIFAKIGI